MQADDESSDTSRSAPGLLTEIGQFGRAFKRLLGAQWQLLAAEFGLARSALSWLLLAGLAIAVAGMGLGLTMLALAGLGLATWLGSWLWALVALCGLQLLFLLGAVLMFRRCLHWMSLPHSRGQWSAMMRDFGHTEEAGILRSKEDPLHAQSADQA